MCTVYLAATGVECTKTVCNWIENLLMGVTYWLLPSYMYSLIHKSLRYACASVLKASAAAAAASLA